MRLWHKDLIPVLPRQQLLAQWRECCCIAHNIVINGTPNHILVNKIMNYSIKHFFKYTTLVHDEMITRGYKCEWSKFMGDLINYQDGSKYPSYNDLFSGWHNDRYLKQCFYNLQEKYDCGGIPENEWKKIRDFMMNHPIIFL